MAMLNNITRGYPSTNVIFHSYGLHEGVLDLKSQKPMVSWEQMMISGYFYGGLLGFKIVLFWGEIGISMESQRHFYGISTDSLNGN